MIVIRRLVDRRRAYTGIFLKGEPPRIFPTSDQEHARILQIYKQDRAHQDVENDFADYALGKNFLPPARSSRVVTAPAEDESPATSGRAAASAEKIEPAVQGPRRDENDASLWLAPIHSKP